MRTLSACIILPCLIFITSLTFGQSAPDAKTVVAAGVALNDQGKYNDAIAKYNEAIAIDPGYATAYYEMSYTLFSAGKGKEAIPTLEKFLQLMPNSGGGYDLLGSIYDDNKEPDKAIEYYRKGISVDPKYQRLHFNLAISYLRQKKYADAEASAVEAIKLDPKHASSQRVYAISTYNLNKRVCSLLAWCNFLMIEPQTARSTEAYTYIHNILNYGIHKTSEKQVNISISPNDIGSGNLSLPIAVLASTTGKSNLSSIDSLQLQLTSVFKIAAELEEKKPQTFYSSFYAKYFGELANSTNMAAFARLVSLSANKEDNLRWFKENDAQLTALDKWIAATERSF